ncbi:MAG: VIT1/CCC1 transporter family protein [Patescibacteria group bacterium]|nr:VIT1/CCC1 transporter family protein [Patescibacteria group bacterium]
MDKQLNEAVERKKKFLLNNKKYKFQEDVYHKHTAGKYIGDLVYGANDGVITTFSVIAGAVGASLSPSIVIILGFANVLADGISMGASNFLGNKSEQEYAKTQKEKEMWEIENLPEIEVEEIREIYRKKGFKGEELEKVVKTITSNKKVWLETMMRDELNIFVDEKDNPVKHSLATFAAFVIAGILPLLPFIIPSFPFRTESSTIIGAITLFTVGALRSLVMAVSWLRGGLEMLLIGSAAATVAFFVGNFLEKLVR